MSKNAEDVLAQRIEMMQQYWNDIARQELKDALTSDVFKQYKRALDPVIAVHMEQVQQGKPAVDIQIAKRDKAIEIINGMKTNNEVPASLHPIFDKMIDILHGTDIHVRLSAPKITVLNRNKQHDTFMNAIKKDKDELLPSDLVTWLKKFYCGRYLKEESKDPKVQAKRNAILDHIQKNPPTREDDIQSYMTRQAPNAGKFFDQGKSLAELLGENRKSKSSKKVPWGLQKVVESFGYQRVKGDISPAKPKKPGYTNL